MPTEDIAKNFVAIMETLDTHRVPNMSHEFITL